jgi:hypothetical protein
MDGIVRTQAAMNMLHQSRRALFVILASLAMAVVARAQQADTPRTAAQPDPAPAASPAAPGDASPQGVHSADAQPTEAQAATKQTQLPPVHVNGGPSDDILRSARDAGFKIKVANGKTHFCKTEAPVGTRFASESCMDEPTVKLWLERAQEQKDRLSGLKGSSTSNR